MKTWYEKCYGEPAPVNIKKAIDPVPDFLNKTEKEIKETAWYRAKHDYMEYLRKQHDKETQTEAEA